MPGYVHCDLKPNNIMLGSDGQVKVIDLGQACKINTVKKRIQGTPDYIAPEQVKCEAVTPRTDVYNFGATLYWVLTGKNLPTLYTMKRSDNSFLVDTKIDSPRDLNPKVPENLSNLVMECVRVNPAKRPETCRSCPSAGDHPVHHGPCRQGFRQHADARLTFGIANDCRSRRRALGRMRWQLSCDFYARLMCQSAPGADAVAVKLPNFNPPSLPQATAEASA